MLLKTYFKTIDSTQIWARNHLSLLEKDRWILCSANEQTSGRGRGKKSWFSPPNVNIYASFIIPFPKEKGDELFYLSQITALSIIETIKLKCQIKWPNDILIEGKKIAGTLIESYNLEDFLAVIIGIGLNVNMDQELCNKTDKPATSLLLETKRLQDPLNKLFFQRSREFLNQNVNLENELTSLKVNELENSCSGSKDLRYLENELVHGVYNRDEILDDLHKNLVRNVALFISEGALPFRGKLRPLIAFIGKEISLEDKTGTVLKGIFEDVTDEGFLKLRVGNKIHIISSGTIYTS